MLPTGNSTFIPKLTLERNGFIIAVNTETPKDLLIMALEASAHVQ